MNTRFDSWMERAETGIGFLDSKYKLVAVNMAKAGPVAGAAVIVSDTTPVAGTARYGTQQPHGLSVGDKVALFGMTATFTNYYQTNQTVSLNHQVQPNVLNGLRYRVIKAGQTGNNEPTWPTVTGELVPNGSVVFRCEGPASIPSDVGIYTVSAVTSNSFDVPSIYYTTYRNGGGYVANLSTQYLAEFAADPTAIRGISDALTSKVMLPGPVYDCADTLMSMTGGGGASQVVLMVETAVAQEEPDWPAAEQALAIFYSSVPGLPYPDATQTISVPISGGADRLIRL